MDLTGQKFGRLTVIKRGEDRVSPCGQKTVRWWCKCNCGNPDLVLVTSQNLRIGKTTSCGCFKLEKLHSNKKGNQYDLSGEYGIGYTSDNREFYFDLEDYDKIKDYCWRINDNGYVISTVGDKNIRMHRIIMGLSDNDSNVIDHKYGDKTRNDNRKYNLRNATTQENSRNHRIRTDNTSGVTGVYKYQRTQKWISYIHVNNKRIQLGTFSNFDDAVKARKDAEERYFGEWSYDNSTKYAEQYALN